MELPSGVFVAKASTEAWKPDPEVPGSEMRELVRADGVWAGLTRFTRSMVRCRGRPSAARLS